VALRQYQAAGVKLSGTLAWSFLIMSRYPKITRLLHIPILLLSRRAFVPITIPGLLSLLSLNLIVESSRDIVLESLVFTCTHSLVRYCAARTPLMNNDHFRRLHDAFKAHGLGRFQRMPSGMFPLWFHRSGSAHVVVAWVCPMTPVVGPGGIAPMTCTHPLPTLTFRDSDSSLQFACIDHGPMTGAPSSTLPRKQTPNLLCLPPSTVGPLPCNTVA